MRIKLTACIVIIVTMVALGTGLYYKMSYKDFNEEKEPLNNFMVGLMSDDLLDTMLLSYENKLDDGNIIVAAKCTESLYFRPSCTTQKVKIEHIFKGDGLKEGDSIDIAGSGSTMSMDDDMMIDGKPSINMDFVNQMIPGKKYLIFLDRKLNTFNKKNVIYITNSEVFLTPIFCYEKIVNKPCKTVDDSSDTAWYGDVKDNEFFLMSDAGIEKMEAVKQKLITKYSY